MIRFIDLKKENASVDYAIAIVALEIENARTCEDKIIKVLHGYGSHGRGGTILIELRKYLKDLKSRNKIKDFFSGDKWSIFNKEIFTYFENDKSMLNDCDLGKNNPGITLIIL